MEFIHHVLGGMVDLIALIIIVLLLPFLRVIDSKKFNTFIEKVLKKIFSEEGLY